MMIKNTPIDLATSMSRFEKREKAIALLKGSGVYVRTWQEISTAAATVGVIVIGLVLWRKGIISIGEMNVLIWLVMFGNLYLLQLRSTRRHVQALTDLVILRETEAAEAESERTIKTATTTNLT